MQHNGGENANSEENPIKATGLLQLFSKMFLDTATNK